MKSRLTTVFATVACASVGALLGAAVAGADPDQNVDSPATYCPSAMMFYNPGYCDPHMPDPLHNHCAGGQMGSMMSGGYCDGEAYPDGSYWRAIQHGAATVEHPGGWMTLDQQCVVRDGSGTRPAPAGGCGGAV